jgi:hypothetical protein
MSAKFTYEYVKNIFDKRGYILLSKNYINKDSKLEYICPNGHTSVSRFNDFKRGADCIICSRKNQASSRRFDFNYVKNYFEKYGCKLLETAYLNCDTKMKYQCSCGNISYISFDSFKHRSRCKECGYAKNAEKIKYRYASVVALLNNEGFLLLERMYINRNHPLQVLCPNGHFTKIRLSDFTRGIRCRQCFYEKNTGKNHPMWNPNKTDEERKIRRRDNEYAQWRQKVLERDNYTCQLTNKQEKIIVHHLEGYANNKKLRYDINNGITLLKNIHDEFHNKFGRRNNTKEQFEEFKNNINIEVYL